MIHMLGDYAKTAPYEVFESKKYKSSGGASEELARLAGSRYVSVSEPSEDMVLNSALIKTLSGNDRIKKYKSSGGASEELARLAGSRYVSVSEPSEDMVLNSALIKTLSGNDRITARYLYENSFEFTASFKLWINTNHLPSIPDDTVFKSGRVQLIPFNRHFKQSEQDRGLKARLTERENISGAFNWCMKGFQLMAGGRVQLIPFNRHFKQSEQDRGLKARLTERENISGAFNWCMKGFQLMAAEGGLSVPECIREEIEKYREANDRIGEFINDCFIVEDIDKKSKVKFSEVYKMSVPECIREEIEKYREANDRIGEFINDCFIVEDIDKKSKVKFSEVYKIYQNWCKDSGYRAMNKKNLKSKMKERVTIESYIGQDQLFGYSIEPNIPKEWI